MKIYLKYPAAAEIYRLHIYNCISLQYNCNVVINIHIYVYKGENNYLLQDSLSFLVTERFFFFFYCSSRPQVAVRLPGVQADVIQRTDE